MIAYLLDLLHSMSTEDDRSSLLSQCVYFVLDQVGIYGVKATEWLIKDNEFRPVKYRDDKLQLLPHPLAEVLNFFVPPTLHFEFYKPFLHTCNRIALA